MTKQRKRLLILLVFVLILLLVLALVFWLFTPRSQVSAPTTQAPPAPTSSLPTSAGTPVNPITSNQELTFVGPGDPANNVAALGEGELFVRQLATLFTERFTSFSNQNDNSHVEDALAISTPSMQEYIRTQQVTQEETYAGVSTRVVAVSVSLYDEEVGEAEVQVDVQRVYRGTNARTEFATARVELEQLEGKWLVSGLFWLDEESAGLRAVSPASLATTTP